MRVYRISLRNYRVFEEALEIEIPSGLVGVYGPNGAGKSYFIESIPWILFGRSRTSVSDIRTSGATSDCETEIEFEHDSHFYKVRRSISPRGLVKARAWIDNELIADGVKETNRLVQSSLGVDIESFRSSVFAEQRQVASFSDATPAERQKLVLSLLGITPLDRARDLARTDFRNRMEQLKLARAAVPPIEGLSEEIVQFRQELETISRKLAEIDDEINDTSLELVKVEAEFKHLQNIKSSREQIVAVGREKKRLYEQLVSRMEELHEIRDRFGEITRQVESKKSEVVDTEELEAVASHLKLELQSIRDSEMAREMLTTLLDQSGFFSVMDLRKAVDAQRENNRRLAEHKSQLVAKVGRSDAELSIRKAQFKDKESKYDQMRDLGSDSLCPTCGQVLGEAFENHLLEASLDLAKERRCLEDLKVKLEGQQREIEICDKELNESAAKLANFEALLHQIVLAEEKVDACHAELTDEEALVHLEKVNAELSRQVLLRNQLIKLQTEGDHLEKIMSNNKFLQGNLDQIRAELNSLRNEASALKFNADYFAGLEVNYGRLAESIDQLKQKRQQLQISAVQMEGRLDRSESLYAQATNSRDVVLRLEAEANLIGRVADYLSEFRRSVIAALGPRLASSAASLFSELTESEYDFLDVDTNSWEIRISDSGNSFDLGRFSGSERDLANLAFRIAISEQIGMSFGEHLGLLVLDEVFGPLDDQRRFTMLGALDRLKSRFNQVIVVTHGADIKEQMPGAVEIVKLGARRATAYVV